MKKTILVVVVFLTFAGCASAGSKKLPDGNYQLTGIDKDGKETTNIMNIDVPFNDPSLPIGLACSEPKTTTVIVEQMGNVVATIECKR